MYSHNEDLNKNSIAAGILPCCLGFYPGGRLALSSCRQFSVFFHPHHAPPPAGDRGPGPSLAPCLFNKGRQILLSRCDVLLAKSFTI